MGYAIKMHSRGFLIPTYSALPGKLKPKTHLTNEGPRVYSYMIMYMSSGPQQLLKCIKENLAHDRE
jgi:hypothetical protein